jgi:HEAT repeat protein
MRVLSFASVLVLAASSLGAPDKPAPAPQGPAEQPPDKNKVRVGNKTLAEWQAVLTGSNDYERRMAAQALGQLGRRAAAAAPLLIQSLSDSEEHVRSDAAHALGRIRPATKDAVLALARTLGEDAEAEVRYEAARALRKIGPGAKAAVPALVLALGRALEKDKDGNVRYEAVQALGKIGPEAEAAVPALIRLLDKDDWQEYALEALAGIGPGAKAAVPAILPFLENGEGYHGWLRLCAVVALGKIGPEARPAVPALAKLLERNAGGVGYGGDSAAMRPFDAPPEDIVAALGSIGPDAKAAVPAMVAVLGGYYGHETAEALARIGPAAAPALLGAMRHKEMPIRFRAAWTLAAIGRTTEAVLPELAELLKDRKPSVRWAAAWALGQIGPKAAPCAPALVESLQDEDILARWAAARALGRIAPRTAPVAAALTAALGDKNREVREAAAVALGKGGKVAGEAEAATIQSLIPELAKIDAAGFQCPQQGQRDAFAPLPMRGSCDCGFDMGLVTGRGRRWSAAFTRLVEFGPTALPLLLRSLGDPTPTKLTLTVASGVWMGFSGDTPINAFSTRESEAVARESAADAREPADEADDEAPAYSQRESASSYTLRVGDICFAAIGQIVNRQYFPATEWHTFVGDHTSINSPVHDARVAAQVRAAWDRPDARQALLESLLLDFHSESLYIKNGAALRLAHYFAEAAEDLVLARLEELDTGEAWKPPTLFDLHGGADLPRDGLLAAVATSPAPKIRAMTLTVFRSATSPRTLLAAMPGVGKEHDELVLRRLQQLLTTTWENATGFTPGPDDVLVALGERFPDRAEATLREYLKPGTVECNCAVVSALQRTCKHLAVPLLRPLLDDKRVRMAQANGDPTEAFRVCDLAAETIAIHSKTLKFDMSGHHPERDRLIDAMRRQIDAKDTKHAGPAGP